MYHPFAFSPFVIDFIAFDILLDFFRLLRAYTVFIFKGFLQINIKFSHNGGTLWFFGKLAQYCNILSQNFVKTDTIRGSLRGAYSKN